MARLYRYKLTKEMRAKLKHPLGNLITGSPKDTMNQLSILVEREAPTCIIAVGDVVTINMIKSGIQADVYIVDNRVLRKDVKTTPIKTRKTRKVRNPAGTITHEAWDAVCKAVKSSTSTKIVIDGEEDLLALPAIACAPFGSYIVYGQPYQGIVVVKVNKKRKEEVEGLLAKMIMKEDDNS
jgi:uncharacterized protein (UPF0218 family)